MAKVIECLNDFSESKFPQQSFLLKSYQDCLPVVHQLDEALKELPGNLGAIGEVFNSSYDSQLGALLDFALDGQAQVESYQENYDQRQE